MFVYQSRFLRRGEVWFDNEPNAQPVDWILYRNRSAPVHGARSRRFYNRLIDLSKSPEQLLSEMEPKTVAKIKAAGLEDKLLCEWSIVVDARQLDEIEGMWNQAIGDPSHLLKLLGKMYSKSALTFPPLSSRILKSLNGPRFLVLLQLWSLEHYIQPLFTYVAAIWYTYQN